MRLVEKINDWVRTFLETRRNDGSYSASKASDMNPVLSILSKGLKNDLESSMPLEQVFQKHVIDGQSYFFREVIGNPDLEYQLRYDLSSQLDISINDVVIVGSAKLGFSVKTLDFYKFDHRYFESQNPREKSDIDIAVVNRKFFEKCAEEIFHLSRHFDRGWINANWRVNHFNKKSPKNLSVRYAMYLARGWIRPDYLPLAYYDQAPWRKICDKWYLATGKRKITVGFYSDWTYLKHYQMDNLDNLRYQLTSLGA